MKTRCLGLAVLLLSFFFIGCARNPLAPDYSKGALPSTELAVPPIATNTPPQTNQAHHPATNTNQPPAATNTQPPPPVMPLVRFDTQGAALMNLESGTASGSRMLKGNSGLVVSLKNPAYLWVIDDASSNRNRVFLIHKTTGARAARFTLTNAGYSVPQVEDLAIGRDPDGTPYLYLSATGNNAMSATEGKIVRFEEPQPEALGDMAAVGTRVQIIRFLLPKPWGTTSTADCETLLFDPNTRDLVYVMKSVEGDKRVHRILHAAYAAADNSLVTLHESAAQTILFARFATTATNVPGNPATRDPGFMNFTGGSVSADGTHLLLISYWDFWIWRLAPGEAAFDALVRMPDQWFLNLRQLSGSENHQRESAAFEPDASGFWSCREQGSSHPPLVFFARQM